jgi:hypothetical protein
MRRNTQGIGACHERLYGAGWSIGEVGTSSGWLVTRTNGENTIGAPFGVSVFSSKNLTAAQDTTDTMPEAAHANRVTGRSAGRLCDHSWENNLWSLSWQSVVVLLALAASAVADQPAMLPDSPAGRRAREFVAAFNGGDLRPHHWVFVQDAPDLRQCSSAVAAPNRGVTPPGRTQAE